MVISKAIYDGAVTYRYLTDGEISYIGDDTEEENILSSTLNILSVLPLDYHMQNLWNHAFTNEALNLKFKSMIGDYLQNTDLEDTATYLVELKCPYYYHEFVRRAILMGIEKDEGGIESTLKLITYLNKNFGLSAKEI